MSRDEPKNTAVQCSSQAAGASGREKVKFEVLGEEMIEKLVKRSANSGRVYLPSEWVGKSVKIIRME